MTHRLIALVALMVFVLSGLGLLELARAATPQPPAMPCHEMTADPAPAEKHPAPAAPHADCDGVGCHCPLSHTPATVTPPSAYGVALRDDRAILENRPGKPLDATIPETLKRPPRSLS